MMIMISSRRIQHSFILVTLLFAIMSMRQYLIMNLNLLGLVSTTITVCHFINNFSLTKIKKKILNLQLIYIRIMYYHAKYAFQVKLLWTRFTLYEIFLLINICEYL